MFFDDASRAFLEPVFPKTWRMTQYHGVLESARRVHDEHLNVGAYHLFRLPEETEQDLYRLIQRTDFLQMSREKTVSKEAALDHLGAIAGSVNEERIGPVAVASIGELETPRTVTAIAAAYLSAFQAGKRTYPYLVG